jgi:hypothetical protein
MIHYIFQTIVFPICSLEKHGVTLHPGLYINSKYFIQLLESQNSISSIKLLLNFDIKILDLFNSNQTLEAPVKKIFPECFIYYVCTYLALTFNISRFESIISKNNVTVEWLPILLCVREVPGSNLGPSTSYPCRDIALLQESVAIMPQVRPQSIRSTAYPIHYVLIILSFDPV